MPKLKVGLGDGENGNANVEPLSITGAAEAQASGAKIGKIQRTQGAEAVASYAPMGQVQQDLGRTQADAGNWLIHQGNEANLRSQQAMYDGIYNMVNLLATNAFNGEAQQSQEQSNDAIKSAMSGHKSVDDVLNDFAEMNQTAPGFRGVAQNQSEEAANFGKIKQGVIEKYSKALPNAEYKQQFTNSINEVAKSKQVQASQQSRQSKVDLNRQSLNWTVDNEIKLGLTDLPENLSMYSGRGLRAITSALKTGTIDPEEASKLSDKLRSGLYRGSMQVANTTSPKQARQLLESSSDKDLNLTPQEYKQLAFQNAAALKDQEREEVAQYKQQNELNKQRQTLVAFQLSEGIKDNTVKSSTIIDSYNSGDLDFDSYIKLLGNYSDSTRKQDKLLDVRDNISKDILEGNTLQNYSESQVNDHYKNLINSRYGKDAKVTLAQKAEVAANYKGPVSDFTNELKFNIDSGDPESIKAGVQAYEYVRQRNPMAVMSLTKDKDTVAFVTSLSNKLQYSSDKADNLIEATKESIYNIDNKTKKKRESAFRDESVFNPNNITKTITNMYDGDPWYRGPNDVPDQLKGAIGGMLKEAYISTGSVSDAIGVVKKQTEGLVGSTEVNKSASWTNDNELAGYLGMSPGGTTMFLPPEKAYQGKYTAQEIRGQLNTDILPIAQQLGVNPDSIMVGSDEKTIALAKAGQDPSYYLYYKTADGHDMPVTDPKTGLVQRWGLDDENKQMMGVAQYNKNAESYQAKVTGMVSKEQQQKNFLELPKIGGNLWATVAAASPKSTMNSADFASKVAMANSTKDIANAYTEEPKANNVILQTIERSLGPDKSPDRVVNSVAGISAILNGSVSKMDMLKQGRVTNNPAVGDLVIGQDAQGLYAGTSTKDGKTMIQVLQMQGNTSVIKEIPTSTASFRTLPENLQAAGIQDRLRYLNSDQTVLGQINKIKMQKEIKGKIDSAVSKAKMAEFNNTQQFDPYTGSPNAPKQEKKKEYKDMSPEEKAKSAKGFNDAIYNNAPKQEAANTADKYSVGVKTVQVGNGGGSSWWDSVVNKLASEDNSAPIVPEMANGKLLNPVYNPQSGTWTNEPKELDKVLQTMQQKLQSTSTWANKSNGAVPDNDGGYHIPTKLKNSQGETYYKYHHPEENRLAKKYKEYYAGVDKVTGGVYTIVKKGNYYYAIKNFRSFEKNKWIVRYKSLHEVYNDFSLD